ncbi:MAG: hypothetical protein HQL52_16180 [Magnetococcales bacterium]|nr:hypothetical protein [Magnetococcales bacterium]
MTVKQHAQAYALRIKLDVDSAQTHALLVSAASHHPYPIRFKLDQDITHPYVIRVGAQNQHPWQRYLANQVRQPIFDTLHQQSSRSWSLLAPVKAPCSHPYTKTVPVANQVDHTFDLLTMNPVADALKRYWNLQSPELVLPSAQAVMKVDGQEIPLLTAKVWQEADGLFWNAEVTLATESDFQTLVTDTPFTLEMGSDTVHLMVEKKIHDRNGPVSEERRVTGISPTAIHAFPRAAPLTQTWEESIMARSAAEELVDDTIDWQIVDWLIGANRLEAQSQSPLEVVQTIARAAGGVVETTLDGSLRVRPHFPVTVPDWDLATPDQIFTDTTDNLQTRFETAAVSRINQITVREEIPAADTPFLAAEIDPRPEGNNLARTTFYAGDTVHFWVTTGPTVSLEQVSASTGRLNLNALENMSMTDDVVFLASDQAVLPRPAQSIQSIIWLGTSLGSLSLGEDGRTITANSEGTSIARITSLVSVRHVSIESPNKQSSLEAFPVQISLTGDTEGAVMEVSQEREQGDLPGEEISDPLLSDYQALYARSEMELNAGEGLQTLEILALYRSSLEPGQLAEVHDAKYGRTFRGQIQSVQHETDGNRLLSRIQLLCRVTQN